MSNLKDCHIFNMNQDHKKLFVLAFCFVVLNCATIATSNTIDCPMITLRRFKYASRTSVDPTVSAL